MEETNGPIIEINTEKKSFLRKAFPYILAFCCLLFGAGSCFNYSKLEGEKAILQKENKALVAKMNESKKAYKVSKDSIKEVTQAKNDTIKALREHTKTQYAHIQTVEKKYKDKVKQLDNWETKTYVSFLKSYYKTEAVVETPKGVELQEDTPKKVVVSLFAGEKYKLESEAKDSIISDKDKEIGIEQSKTKDALFERDRAEEVIFDQGAVISNQDQLLDNAKKENNKLKAKNLIKTIGIPAGFVLGAAAGILLTR